MSHGESDGLTGGERKAEVKRMLFIMIVWTAAAVGAGLLLVLLRDPLASIFALTAPFPFL
ncbi:hypothetical protein CHINAEXTREME_01855 [Halobiforma lacisalsi AJ5]|nr:MULTISPECIES: hypothetical protein [Halobiforma]APW96590.1 hypothetical protein CHINAEXTREME_01855 [Halobiforma lacisalsi AJ5]SFB69020.1 hypothetical protein SAMN05444422_101208 [Halobiforma haloterrestris]